jgi:hypothetical protein
MAGGHSTDMKLSTPGMGLKYFSAPAINSSAAVGIAGSVKDNYVRKHGQNGFRRRV